jgi:WD40 repeat protein/predicted Ser/Thr protein kinase
VTGERLERIEGILLEAMRIDRAERAAHLDAACGDDADLRAEVEKLIASRDTLGDFLEAPATQVLAAEHLSPGTRIGRYEIVEWLATGGAGEVYVARQEQPNRRVALKVLRGGATTHRLQEEADILARLQHPDVAHVYEAGTHDDSPYIALELVEGARNLVEHTRELARDDRLRLFVRICDAVQHGHQKGIVHLDLKPANILVLPSGRPKIIDFGIARVEEAGAEDQPIVGTPPYMSPEQFAADRDDVDSRADVYALGVLLYEIETGTLPHAVTGVPITEAARRIREEPPAPVDRDLPADLRAILRKALAKDREDRYATASELGADVRALLGHRPVAARRAGRLHLARLFVRRHRLLVAALALLTAILVGATLVSTRYAYRAIEARDRERAQAYRANISAAHAALRLNDVAEARRQLELAAPDLRHWEWDYLAGQLDSSDRTYPAEGLQELYAAIGPGGATVWATGHDLLHRDSGTLLVWGAATGGLERELAIPKPPVTPPAFSPDGRYVAWGEYEGGIRLLESTSLEPVVSLEGHRRRVNTLRYSPDGKTLASSSDDGTVRFWNVATGELLWELGDGVQPKYDIRFSPDGSLFAASIRGYRVELWNAGSREPLTVFEGHSARVTVILFSPDGELLVTASADGSLRIWEVTTGREVTRLGEAEKPITSGDLSPDGTRMLTAHTDGTISLWDLRRGARVAVLRGHEPWPLSVRFAPDGKSAISGSYRGRAKRWDLERMERPPYWDAYDELVRDVAYSRDGAWIATAAFDGTVRAYHLEDPVEELVIDEVDGGVQSVAFDAQATRVAAASNAGNLHVWDLASGEEVTRIETEERFHPVEFSPDGSMLVSGSTSNRATLWDVATGEPVRVFPHSSWVWTTLFTRDGRRLVTTSHDGWLRVWDAATGAEVAADRVHEGELSCAAFVPGEPFLIAGGEDRIGIWDTRTWQRLALHTVPLRYIQGVAPTPDGKRIVVASDRSVAVVDAGSGHVLLDLKEHTTLVWDVAMHPDGSQFATVAGGYSSEGCELRLWGRLPGLDWPPRLLRE